MPTRLTSLFFFVALCGCSAFTAKDDLEQLDRLTQQGLWEEARPVTQRMAREHGDSHHRVIFHLHELIASYWTADLKGALKAGQRAEKEMIDHEKRATVSLRNLGSKTAALLVNETVRPYRGSLGDRQLVNTYRALCFWRLGDLEAARVEMRRAADLRARSIDLYSKMIQGSTTEKNGLKKDHVLEHEAVRSFQARHYGDGRDREEELINPAQVFSEAILYAASKDAKHQHHAKRLLATLEKLIPEADWEQLQAAWKKDGSSSAKHLVVMVESGSAPKLRSESLDLPFTFNDRLTYLHLSLPVFDVGANQGSSLGEPLANRMDLFNVEMRHRWPSLLWSQAVSAWLKAAVENQLAKENEWLGLAASILNSATNRADTRSWSSLPARWRWMVLPVLDGQVSLPFGEKEQKLIVPDSEKAWFLHVKTNPSHRLHSAFMER